MLTDQDIKNLRQGLLIKEDLEPLAKAADLANVEKKVDDVQEAINQVHIQLPVLIAHAIDISAFKIEQDEMKKKQDKIVKVLRDKLHVEI